MTGPQDRTDWRRLAQAALAQLHTIIEDPAVRDRVAAELLRALSAHAAGAPGVRRILTSRPELREWVRTQVPVEELRSAEPPAAEMSPIPGDGPGLLDGGPSPEDPSPPVEPPRPDRRWINAELEDHAPAEPLKLGEVVTLAFDVDVRLRPAAVGGAVLDDASLFPEGVDEVTLTVQVDSEDFDVADPSRPLRLRRTGGSRGKARFDITPLRDGRCSLTATIHHQGNFVQKLDLTMSVGGAPTLGATVSSTGRPPSAAVILQPRDLTLMIEPGRAGGYSCTVINDGAAFRRVELPITPAALANAIDTARNALMQVINTTDHDGNLVFQSSVDIADAQQDQALRILARSGGRLFQQLFFPNDGDDDLRALGTHIRTVAGDPQTRLQLQVVTKEFPVPWGTLYIGDASAAAVPTWDGFLGFRHIIEQLPLQAKWSTYGRQIVTDQPSLLVSTTMNDTIDVTMQSSFVADQRAFWDTASTTRQRLRLTRRDRSDELLRALSTADTEEHILYLYCHATAPRLGAPGGLDDASLGLADSSVTLADLNLDAPTAVTFRGSPLVFINACESATQSPLFYEGFVPYFMAKGARGVIGTECKTPALFAARWAERFFDRFLDGESLGEAFLALRQEFLRDHGNPLGLLYGVHCDGDTQLFPALAAAPV